MDQSLAHIDTNNAEEKPAAFLSLKELQTRFVYPFTFRYNKEKMASQRLQKAQIAGRPVIWIAPFSENTGRESAEAQKTRSQFSHRRSVYGDEILYHVVNYLFPEKDSIGCEYLAVSNSVLNSFFHNAEIELHSREKLPLKVINRVGCEVFLTPQGIGILSIALAPNTEGLDLSSAIDFNYQIAKVHPTTSARIHLRNPLYNPQTRDLIPEADLLRLKSDPGPESGILERLGARGSYFTLAELVDELLRPLDTEEFRLERVNYGFSVFTVARFGEKVDFESTEVCNQIAPFLSALAQVEEPSHAGAPQGVVGVANVILNRRHWAAVGQLGAAHLVADQPDIDGKEHSFNEQRVARVRDKYFVPYVMALIQRLTLNKLIAETSVIIHSGKSDMREQLAALRTEMLKFAVSGHFTQVSSREAIHRFYRVVQEGLDVQESWQEVRQAIADIDAKQTETDQAEIVATVSKNLDAIKSVQEIVHLIEYFIISVYSAHLWHMFAAENHQLHHWVSKQVYGFQRWAGLKERFLTEEWFVSVGVIVFALMGIVIAQLVIKLQKKLKKY